MGLETKITNRLNNNNVQVEISNPKTDTKKYFSVPEKKADEFITSYKKNDKNVSVFTNTIFVSSILAGVLLVSACTRNIKSKALKWILNTTGGIVGAVCSFSGSDKYIQKKQDKLLKEYQAQEIKM